MTAKELKLTTENTDLEIESELDSFRLSVIGEFYQAIYLDRNQAHLLKLWLEEHLK